MSQNDTVNAAAFGPDSAFALLHRSIPVQPFLVGVEQLIVDEASFNAFAEQKADADRVGIYSGTIAKVTEKIGELEDFLPSFRGRSNLKTELWWDELDEAEAKFRLTCLCIDFIVFHELSHIALNHCVAASPPNRSLRLYETPIGSLDGDTSNHDVDTRHAFELFADKLSTSVLSGALPRLASLHPRFRFRHPSASWMGFVWAIQIVWAILAESSKDYVSEQMAFLTALREGRVISQPWFTHPHPSLRRAVAGDSLYSFGRGWRASLFSGFLKRDSEVAIDSFLSPRLDALAASKLSALAVSSKVVARYKRICNIAWRRYRDQLLPASRFQSSMLVWEVMKRYGWDRAFMLVYQKEPKGIIEQLMSITPPTFVARNSGVLPRGHDAHEL